MIRFYPSLKNNRNPSSVLNWIRISIAFILFLHFRCHPAYYATLSYIEIHHISLIPNNLSIRWRVVPDASKRDRNRDLSLRRWTRADHHTICYISGKFNF